jgi:hypothetical protein
VIVYSNSLTFWDKLQYTLEEQMGGGGKFLKNKINLLEKASFIKNI